MRPTAPGLPANVSRKPQRLPPEPCRPLPLPPTPLPFKARASSSACRETSGTGRGVGLGRLAPGLRNWFIAAPPVRIGLHTSPGRNSYLWQFYTPAEVSRVMAQAAAPRRSDPGRTAARSNLRGGWRTRTLPPSTAAADRGSAATGSCRPPSRGFAARRRTTSLSAPAESSPAIPGWRLLPNTSRRGPPLAAGTSHESP